MPRGNYLGAIVLRDRGIVLTVQVRSSRAGGTHLIVDLLQDLIEALIKIIRVELPACLVIAGPALQTNLATPHDTNLIDVATGVLLSEDVDRLPKRSDCTDQLIDLPHSLARHLLPLGQIGLEPGLSRYVIAHELLVVPLLLVELATEGLGVEVELHRHHAGQKGCDCHNCDEYVHFESFALCQRQMICMTTPSHFCEVFNVQ